MVTVLSEVTEDKELLPENFFLDFFSHFSGLYTFFARGQWLREKQSRDIEALCLGKVYPPTLLR